MAAGMPTVRRPARDLSGPSVILLPGARRSEKAARTRTRPASRSMSDRFRRGRFAPPQAGEGGEQHQGAEPTVIVAVS